MLNEEMEKSANSATQAKVSTEKEENLKEKEEKEQALENHNKKREKKILIGKSIILVIAISNMTLSLLSFIIVPGGSFFSVLVQVALSIALIYRVRWVRWFFIIGPTIATLFFISISTSGAGRVEDEAILHLVLLLLSIAIAILLLSEPVREYMNE